MDKIIIKGLYIEGRHGLNEKEKQEKQPFIVDCSVYIKKSRLFLDDNINNTVNYTKICENIKNTVETNIFNLIEKLCEEIAKNVLIEFDKIDKVKVTVKKPNAPIKFVRFKYMGVKLERKRCDYNI